MQGVSQNIIAHTLYPNKSTVLVIIFILVGHLQAQHPQYLLEIEISARQ